MGPGGSWGVLGDTWGVLGSPRVPQLAWAPQVLLGVQGPTLEASVAVMGAFENTEKLFQFLLRVGFE